VIDETTKVPGSTAAAGLATVVGDGDPELGMRATRTRAAIVDAARTLFLDLGYTGTRINNITDACGISRAGFYTYFKDKREVFNLLGEATYRDILDTIGRWDSLPNPCPKAEVENWVREYFSFMDSHGPFIFASAQSAPTDEEFRAAAKRMQMRVAWLFGVNLRNRQIAPTDAPEALGLTTMAMLDRSWYHVRVQGLPVDDGDVISTVTSVITSIIQVTD
jgi:AcrR family transcriptional regulator